MPFANPTNSAGLAAVLGAFGATVVALSSVFPPLGAFGLTVLAVFILKL